MWVRPPLPPLTYYISALDLVMNLLLFAYVLVAIFLPSVLLLYLLIRLVLLLIEKFLRFSKLQERILIIIIVAIYIAIGCSIYLNYLWSPEKYNPQYLNWLKTTPFDEQFIDITSWPMLYLFPHLFNPH